SDPDATYRLKAGKAHRGYAANLTEAVNENGSIVTDYQYDVNTHSDNAFIKEELETLDKADDEAVIVADGAYSSKEVRELAGDKNITVVTTGLLGRKPRNILLDFTLSEDERTVVKCPSGHTPKASSYTRQNDTIRISFPRETCEDYPHKKECMVRLKKRTAVMVYSVKARHRAGEIRDRKEDPFLKLAGRIRNGVETLPSILRCKYNVDRMPVRWKLKTKQFFGFKVYALNFTKLLRHLQGLEKCRSLTPETT
ncbi:Transposase DDE domain-containing protein, partial [Lachnospiraceae bacterium NK3A20]